MSLRAIPGLRVIRPADANETAMAYRVAINGTGPTGMVLSRQNLPVLEGTAANDGVARGAYVLRDGDGAPQLVLIGTGSEVSVALEAADQLAADGTSVRVVSMPSWELFEEQSAQYQREVLPAAVPTLAVEAGVTFGWTRWADDAVGIDRFGASAPGAVALANLGINPENVVAHARGLLHRS
jgi:transketolase